MKGKTTDDAYAAAGFKPERECVSITEKDNIRQRVTELLQWEQTIERKAIEKVIDKPSPKCVFWKS